MRLSLLAFAAAAALAPGLATAATLDVPLDQAVRLTLATPAKDVIVGNPNIADVEIADQRHLVLTGKTSGATNLIVIDERGRTVFNREIFVSEPTGSRVAFINGPAIATYACTPGCIVVPGGLQAAPPGVGTSTTPNGTMTFTVTQSAPPAPAAPATPPPPTPQP
ncbi:MAG TPA: pilus assembly protein N-terminal domain-containing protein [Caulobacteraceae bacterium]